MIKIKRKLIIIALALSLINAGGWSVLSAHAAHLKLQTNHSRVNAAHLKSQTNYKPVSKSHDVRKTSNGQKAIENGSASEDENLPGGGHADTDGENVDHQFEGVE